VHIRSDIIRKRAFNVAPTQRLPRSGYSSDATRKVYRSMREEAALALGSGFSAIADAVHGTTSERALIAAVADRRGVPFTGLWLEAPLATRLSRVASRRDDASDATASYARRQAAAKPRARDWHQVAAGGRLDETVRASLACLDGERANSSVCGRPEQGCRAAESGNDQPK
jgi:predicted kinase